MRSILWGCPGWSLSRFNVAVLESFEISLLRRMISRHRQPHEDWVQWMKRSATTCRDILKRMRQRPLLHAVYNLMHGWSGHLARLPETSAVKRLLHHRQVTWWRSEQMLPGCLDSQNRSGWKRPAPGRPTGWELQFESFPLHWQDTAQNREQWKVLRDQFIQHFPTKHKVRNDSGRQAVQGPIEENHAVRHHHSFDFYSSGFQNELLDNCLKIPPWPFPRNRFPNWDFALESPHLSAFDFDAPNSDPSIRSFHLIG